jgi:hypothetical protein
VQVTEGDGCPVRLSGQDFLVDLGERWPSRLVATAEEDRLNISACPQYGTRNRKLGPAP